MNDLRDAKARHAFVEDWFLNRKNCDIDINGETFWLPELADEDAIRYLGGLLDAAIAAGVGAVPADLVRLSGEATKGPWVKTRADWPETYTLCGLDKVWTITNDPKLPGWNTDMGNGDYGMSETNAEFTSACVNFVRAMIAAAPTPPAAAEEG